MELFIHAVTFCVKKKGGAERVFTLTPQGIAKIEKRNYIAILINVKFTCR